MVLLGRLRTRHRVHRRRAGRSGLDNEAAEDGVVDLAHADRVQAHVQQSVRDCHRLGHRVGIVLARYREQVKIVHHRRPLQQHIEHPLPRARHPRLRELELHRVAPVRQRDVIAEVRAVPVRLVQPVIAGAPDRGGDAFDRAAALEGGMRRGRGVNRIYDPGRVRVRAAARVDRHPAR